jgi:hypothetical protein
MAAHAHMGFNDDSPRCWQVYAEDEDALAITAKLSALSEHHRRNGLTPRIRLGPRVWRNLHRNDT